MAFHIDIDVNAKIEDLEKVQRAFDEINGRVGVLSKSTGKMENVMTGLPRLSFHPGRRSNNFSMTYHTPSIPTKSIPFTSMSKMVSIAVICSCQRTARKRSDGRHRNLIAKIEASKDTTTIPSRG